MTLEQQLLTELRALSPEQQQAVLDFTLFLKQQASSKKPRKSLLGLWADLNINLSEEDIDQARKEMWASFPRDD